MKIELKDGTFIHVNSADELAEALKVIGGANPQVNAEPERKPLDLDAQLADEGQRVRAVFSSVNRNARKFMAELLPHKTGLRGDAFSDLTGFSSDKFGGMMGGVSKCAENQRLRRDQFIVSDQRSAGTERVRFLTSGKLLLKYEFDLRKVMQQKGEVEGKPAVSMGA